MKYGVYFTYWVNDYIDDFRDMIPRAKRCGLDILEVGAFNFYRQEDSYFRELRQIAADNDIILTAGYGPSRDNNIGGKDPAQVQRALDFYEETFRKMELAGIGAIGGALYSYWPIDANEEIDKAADFERSVQGMRKLADLAANHGVTLNMESLNRFEGYLINVASECVEYVKAVDKPNVKVMLDTFHMNIEENSIVDAIHTAGSLLGHLHVGEANRRPPCPGPMPWKEIGQALRDIHYDGNVVMEPFVRMGGQVGKDIRIWRDLSGGADDAQMDQALRDSVAFLKTCF